MICPSRGKADKHSTGGVGDTTTLITAPGSGLAALQNVRQGAWSHRQRPDKLESIGPRLIFQWMNLIGQTVGLSVIGQSKNLVLQINPVWDRDVTGTVDSIPLIASNIMSKKITAGSDVIVLDVKTGSGAFMESLRMHLQRR